ncbi:basic helix-loop-helix (bHLH) DNA-binding superfamily protein [Rhynchospora pubera]|uniref:Basic helix-loop-helix (BHLH) DNA-binding superfamily protein n=1 Tax=Rhynchospora pubera TaxID=906938 RepID=A0AAV8FA44_9POAL|nr:basic helix-loop-helix (bHLH) DNA-binding superfamily protein [Rhynchospora pubera]
MENPLSEARQHSQTIIEERGKRIKLAAEIGLARSSSGRHWARALRRRLYRKPPQREYIVKNPTPLLKKEVPLVAEVVADVAEEKEEIEDKVRALQRLVPGGEEMEVDRLFEETADYIEALREQVGVMRALACILDGMESRDGDKL